MSMMFQMSPCLGCIRVKNPENCENKNCLQWRRWFISRWDKIHQYPRYLMEQPPEPAGVMVGGVCYAAPHQVMRYLESDPCNGCACSQDLCSTPCRARQYWAKVNGEVKS